MHTPNDSHEKGERIQIRIDHTSYDILKKAASFSHATLSAFIKEASLVAAKEIIKEKEIFSLSDDDWKLFLNALETPPRPNINLKKALKYYKDSTQ